MTNPDDDRLSRAVAGDRQALADLLEAHGPKVRSALTASFPRKWQSLLSVDDVLQQAYTDAFRAITNLEPLGVSYLIGLPFLPTRGMSGRIWYVASSPWTL